MAKEGSSNSDFNKKVMPSGKNDNLQFNFMEEMKMKMKVFKEEMKVFKEEMEEWAGAKVAGANVVAPIWARQCGPRQCVRVPTKQYEKYTTPKSKA
uniref:Uncharacterized protein n=1 Tax=Meloidogyne javanica TaxID=6303 RepID=A0A915LXV3_MELJA